MEETFKLVKQASRSVGLLTDDKRNIILHKLADLVRSEKQMLLMANAMDLDLMEKTNPLYDRLQLTESRLEGIADSIDKVCSLPSPLGCEMESRTLPNGLKLRKVSVPFGVIGVIYEARPNVTFDVFTLCFKSGSATILKGGKDADNSNRAAMELIHRALSENGVDENAAVLLPSTHQAAAELLTANGYVDLIIPRGGRRLIDFVRSEAKVPCIETGAGVVNTYLDKYADTSIAINIILNAKTRRVSVCNALDCLIVHKDRLKDLAQICMPMASKNVEIIADKMAYDALKGSYPVLEHASEDTYGTEFMDYRLAIKTVSSLQEALAHIDRYGSGHSECIITENAENAALFQSHVDAACVYVNAPTSFTDGGEFGLGAEIGISTQKLGARGPMGLKEICSYKWLIEGHGQVRA